MLPHNLAHVKCFGRLRFVCKTNIAIRINVPVCICPRVGVNKIHFQTRDVNVLRVALFNNTGCTAVNLRWDMALLYQCADKIGKILIINYNIEYFSATIFPTNMFTMTIWGGLGKKLAATAFSDARGCIQYLVVLGGSERWNWNSAEGLWTSKAPSMRTSWSTHRLNPLLSTML